MKKSLLIITLLSAYAGTLSAQNQEIEREYIEWADIYVPGGNRNDLPHILLIGNSITRGYHPKVEKALEGRAYVARLSTSKSIGDPALIEEIETVMKNTRFDIVHFNNGLHGENYSEETYDLCFPDMLEAIRRNAPEAKLIWATCTPMFEAPEMTRQTEWSRRGEKRNAIALRHVSAEGIEIDDLRSIVEGHPEYYVGGDGAHPIDMGYEALAKQVISVLEPALQNLIGRQEE